MHRHVRAALDEAAQLRGRALGVGARCRWPSAAACAGRQLARFGRLTSACGTKAGAGRRHADRLQWAGGWAAATGCPAARRGTWRRTVASPGADRPWRRAGPVGRADAGDASRRRRSRRGVVMRPAVMAAAHRPLAPGRLLPVRTGDAGSASVGGGHGSRWALGGDASGATRRPMIPQQRPRTSPRAARDAIVGAPSHREERTCACSTRSASSRAPGRASGARRRSLFAAEGASVAVADIDRAAADETVATDRGGRRLRPVPTTWTSPTRHRPRPSATAVVADFGRDRRPVQQRRDRRCRPSRTRPRSTCGTGSWRSTSAASSSSRGRSCRT